MADSEQQTTTATSEAESPTNSSSRPSTRRAMGTTILQGFFARRKKDAGGATSDAGATDVDPADAEDVDTLDPLGGKKKGRKKASTKSRGNLKAEMEAEELEQQRKFNDALTGPEKAFLPMHVRKLLQHTGELPKTPRSEVSHGVALFADISGFTQLGRELRSKMEPLEAASTLAIRIGGVLQTLTDICLEFEGDVAKFAGDALLCIWEGHEDLWMLERAKACAVQMLNTVKDIDPALDLHGGIAMGNLLHLHIGDKRHQHLWYLVTGDAVIRAANLVDEAPRGQILYEPRRNSASVPGPGDSSSSSPALQPPPALARLPSVIAREVITQATKTMLVSKRKSQGSGDGEVLVGRAGAAAAAADDDGGMRGTRQRTNTEDDPFLNEKITPKGRSYIPKLLKEVLMSGRIEVGEMRTDVAIVFASFPSLTLSEEEIATNVINEARERLVNDTFADITQIVHQTDGEIRDLLFDDKGCILIAVFGAYGAIEMPELKAIKCARRMTEELEVEHMKIGISIGTCFVGLVGNDLRHDMIVMGHEVNIAARLMSKANTGQIIVGPKIKAATDEYYEFTTLKVELRKQQNVPANPSNNTINSNTPGTPLLQQQALSSFSSRNRFDTHDNDLMGEDTSKGAVGGGGQTSSASAENSGPRFGGSYGRTGPSEVADPNGLVDAYIPVKEQSRTKRASFAAFYRYTQAIPEECFVGRKAELAKIQGHILKANSQKTSAMCIVSGPRGIGKSWLIREFWHRNMDKFVSTMGVAFELNVTTTLHVVRQVLERSFGLAEGMPKSDAAATLARWTKAGIKLDYALLEKFFPYIPALVPPPRDRRVSNAGSSGTGMLGRLKSLRFAPSSSTLPVPGGIAEEETEGGVVLDGPVVQVEEIHPAAPSGGGGGEEDRSSSTGGSPMIGARTMVRQTGSKETAAAAHPGMSGDSSEPPSAGERKKMMSSRMLGGLTGGSSGSNRSLQQQAGGGGGGSSRTLLKKEAEEKSKELRMKRKMSRLNLNAMGKRELDPIVDFVFSLLTLAVSEAIKLGKKGLVVILEDIQWMDAVSFQVFGEIVEKMMTNPKSFPNLHFVVSCRNADPDKSEEQYYSSGTQDMRPVLEHSFLSKMHQCKLFTEVQPDAFSRDETDLLVSKRLCKGSGDTVSPDVLQDIFKNTGGMPNAIETVIRFISTFEDGAVHIDRGALFLDINTNQWRWKVSVSKTPNGQPALGGKSVLAKARQAYITRIDGLSLETRDYLKIAACTCDDKLRFRLQDLVDVIERDLENKSRYVRANSVVPRLEHVENALQSAIYAGIVRNNKGFLLVIDEWSFGSSAIQETVLEMVPTERRKEIQEFNKTLRKEKDEDVVDNIARGFLGGPL